MSFELLPTYAYLPLWNSAQSLSSSERGCWHHEFLLADSFFWENDDSVLINLIILSQFYIAWLAERKFNKHRTMQKVTFFHFFSYVSGCELFLSRTKAWMSDFWVPRLRSGKYTLSLRSILQTNTFSLIRRIGIKSAACPLCRASGRFSPSFFVRWPRFWEITRRIIPVEMQMFFLGLEMLKSSKSPNCPNQTGPWAALSSFS